ncbi:MAG TPA: acetate/propionate family kinase [Acidobacteriaceae bacterium]|jgi:acetate kinase|nr:acetate/propionate family kinase [Acidobacteriaceae bacterium]
MKCLIPNIGSTSFKYRVLNMPGESVLASGRVERIGQPGGDCPDYPSAIRKCIQDVVGPGKALKHLSEIEAVGFKAVHAGPISGPCLIDDELLAAMADFSFFAPAHNPPYIAAMKAFRNELPGVPLVAVFETIPYASLDEAATTYAVPYEWRTKYGIRRYGFHGASHRAARENVRKQFNKPGLRHISCHLGGSSSIAAFRDGVTIDTSFGTSPQSGLPQNNRVGDIDAFAVLYMMKKLNVGPDEMARILGSESGLAGISGTSGDMRDLDEAAAAGSQRARLALDVYVRAIRRYLGAFLLELDGVDVISFSGGIGENSWETRAAVCRNLAAFEIEMDDAVNRAARTAQVISSRTSAVKVLIIPADEESIVARDTVSVVEKAVLERVGAGQTR